MSILLDTNILVRSAHAGHAMQRLAADSVEELLRQGETLCVVPQNLYEFWVVCTRPVAQNGLGMSFAEVQAEFARIKALFTLLDDAPAIFSKWEQLVIQHQVQGKSAHDARLVAAMLVHGLSRILTFNVGDFQRYQTLTVLDPQKVVSGTP
jgi:predicted nucleic acid-binding protein